MSETQTFHAGPDDTQTRLDHFLVAHLPDVSRAHVQALIEDEKILIDGKPSKPSINFEAEK